jgi:YggT family protein
VPDAGAFGRLLADITEPIVGPIRRVLPPVGGFDLSPILAIILVQILGSFLAQLANNA